jgi:hypothetical protein
VEIYNIAGHRVEAYGIRPMQNGSTTIDISHLSKGIYFVKIGNVSAKVVKQ